MNYICNEIKTSTNLFYSVISIYHLQKSALFYSPRMKPYILFYFCTIVLYYSVCFSPFSISTFISRWCSYSFYKVCPPFIIPLSFILSIDFIRIHLYFSGKKLTNFAPIHTIPVGSFQIISVHILTSLWIKNHNQSMAFMVESFSTTKQNKQRNKQASKQTKNSQPCNHHHQKTAKYLFYL